MLTECDNCYEIMNTENDDAIFDNELGCFYCCEECHYEARIYHEENEEE